MGRRPHYKTCLSCNEDKTLSHFGKTHGEYLDTCSLCNAKKLKDEQQARYLAVMKEGKSCAMCQQHRDGRYFRIVRRTKGGVPILCSYCTDCEKIRAHTYFRNGKLLERNVGVDEIAKYVKMAQEAYGKPCEICGDTRSTRVDHNHTTCKVRGYVCHRCNTCLGYLKDDLEYITNIALYLQRHE